MENQHRKIRGYRDLSEDEIDAINRIKSHSGLTEELVYFLRDQMAADQRWVSIGMTHLQQGFMALTRAVAKPDSF